jgi:two-component system, OmpR family, phosphate regulon sensor histidine kinase PhoR
MALHFGVSLHTRLMISMSIVLLLAVFLPGYLLYKGVSEEVRTQETERARQQLLHVEWLLRTQADRLGSPEVLQRYIQSLGGSLDARITLIHAGGRVMADSSVSAEQLQALESHAFRPEIIDARSMGLGSSIRFSESVEHKPLLLYIAMPVEGIPGVEEGFLRMAVPYSRVQERLDLLTSKLAPLLVISLLVLGMIILVLVRSMSKSISGLVDTADAIGRGNYTKRIRVVPGREFENLAISINSMADAIEQKIKTITSQKGQLEAVLDGIREGVAVLDEHCVIRDANSYLRRIFSNVVELRGLRPLELTRNPRLQSSCEHVLAERSAGRLAPANIQLELKGERAYDVDIVPLQVRDVELALVLVFHDITEHKRLEKIRRDFVANVSHELRTPLTSIKGYAETLLGTELDDKETRDSFLQIIIRNSDTMSTLVRDLLQLARLESVREVGTLAEADPREALQEAWRTCSALAEDRGISLQDELPEEGGTVRFQKDQLVQVFRNLLENAIKYSPRGQPVRVFHHLSDDRQVFGVMDRGPGVPPAEQERIFERFYRVEKHRTARDLAGTGLGLAICRHIVRNHGGKIWVESPPKGERNGSVFFFSIPTAVTVSSEQHSAQRGVNR